MYIISDKDCSTHCIWVKNTNVNTCFYKTQFSKWSLKTPGEKGYNCPQREQSGHLNTV